MFLGMQNASIACISENREEIEKLPNILITDIIETDRPVELINGIYQVGENSIKEAKQIYVRSIRNRYLEEYVDPIVSNPLRWADLDSIEQQRRIDYRLYLLNYTEKENWWENEPLTFDDWI